MRIARKKYNPALAEAQVHGGMSMAIGYGMSEQLLFDEKTGKLSVDETTFKSADTEKIKNLFNGTGSYAYSVATKAAMTESYAKSEAAKSNTYTKNGTYNYNYNSGNIFTDMF